MKLMEQWTRRNLSDHCGFHHRQFLLMELYSLTKKNNEQKTTSTNRMENDEHINCTMEELKDYFRREFYFTERLILLYPGHEAIWYHKRFLIIKWRELFASFIEDEVTITI
jgi:protein prenyltransferase alpha subunit repeat containing protein 1